jgi:hypothetical protein
MKIKELDPPASYVLGIRNKNPMNIRGNIAWIGSLGLDENNHHIFDHEMWSVRAWLRTISNYWSSGARSLLDITNRYAPISENDPALYAKFLAKRLSTYVGSSDHTATLPTLFSPKGAVAHPGLIRALAKAMAEYENFSGYSLPNDSIESAIAHYTTSFVGVQHG